MAKTPANTPVDVYDFDHTIYDGDCSLDFYFFCLRRKPSLIRFLPYQLWHGLKFVLHSEDRTAFKSRFFAFLKGLDDTERFISEFWEGHSKKIKAWYKKSDHAHHVIISASPEFLLQPAFQRLEAHTLLATRMDPKTGEITGKNCRGQEKVVRFREAFGDTTIRKAYADSPADKFILSLAKEKYIVNGDKIVRA